MECAARLRRQYVRCRGTLFRWNLLNVLVHAFVAKIRSLRNRRTLHGIVTMDVCVLKINQWVSLPLAYSVDISSHEPSSLFHRSVKVYFNDSVIMMP